MDGAKQLLELTWFNRVLVRELIGEEDFVGQKWGYVIAYESDIRASESWEDLKRKSNPGL